MPTDPSKKRLIEELRAQILATAPVLEAQLRNMYEQIEKLKSFGATEAEIEAMADEAIAAQPGSWANSGREAIEILRALFGPTRN